MASLFHLLEHMARDEPEYVGDKVDIRHGNVISFIKKDGKYKDFFKSPTSENDDVEVVALWLDTIPKWLFEEDREFRFHVGEEFWICTIGESCSTQIDPKKKNIWIKRKTGEKTANLFSKKSMEGFSTDDYDNMVAGLNGYLPKWHDAIKKERAAAVAKVIETNGVKEQSTDNLIALLSERLNKTIAEFLVPPVE